VATHEQLTEAGPPRVHLWQATPLLRQAIELHPAPLAGKALDLACGTGRDAVYLALHGYSVDAVDILPDALTRATSLADHCGVTLNPLVVDLRRQWPFADGTYDLLCMFRFLHRPILPRMPLLLRPGGLLVIETFHEASAKTSQGPVNPSHLLATGELRRTFADLEILHHADAVERGGRFFSQFIARRPGRQS
jgi:SAM-dependent methyltransferase